MTWSALSCWTQLLYAACKDFDCAFFEVSCAWLMNSSRLSPRSCRGKDGRFAFCKGIVAAVLFPDFIRNPLFRFWFFRAPRLCSKDHFKLSWIEIHHATGYWCGWWKKSCTTNDAWSFSPVIKSVGHLSWYRIMSINHDSAKANKSCRIILRIISTLFKFCVISGYVFRTTGT